jgi:hypothetical protein
MGSHKACIQPLAGVLTFRETVPARQTQARSPAHSGPDSPGRNCHVRTKCAELSCGWTALRGQW